MVFALNMKPNGGDNAMEGCKPKSRIEGTIAARRIVQALTILHFAVVVFPAHANSLVGNERNTKL